MTWGYLIGGLDNFKQTAKVCCCLTTERACLISAADPKLSGARWTLSSQVGSQASWEPTGMVRCLCAQWMCDPGHLEALQVQGHQSVPSCVFCRPLEGVKKKNSIQPQHILYGFSYLLFLLRIRIWDLRYRGEGDSF